MTRLYIHQSRPYCVCIMCGTKETYYIVESHTVVSYLRFQISIAMLEQYRPKNPLSSSILRENMFEHVDVDRTPEIPRPLEI